MGINCACIELHIPTAHVMWYIEHDIVYGVVYIVVLVVGLHCMCTMLCAGVCMFVCVVCVHDCACILVYCA